MTCRGAGAGWPTQCTTPVSTAAKAATPHPHRVSRRTRCRLRKVLRASALKAALAACQVSSRNVASSRASSLSGSGFVLMAQVFQQLFFELLAEPTQPGFDGLVSQARFISQFPERSIVHVSGLD